MASEDKNQTILSSKRDWERWLQPIKSKALGTEVWDYINPDTKESDKKELIEPEAPKKEQNETSEDFQYRRDLHKRALAKYDIKEAHIAAIRQYIYQTIDRSANLLIQDKSTVRDILSELAKRYKPDTNREQFDILNKWTSLKTGPAGKRQFNAWIKDWIETYNRARQYKIPGIGTDEKYAMIEFMLAIQQSYEVFYSTWYEAVYNDREKSFIELITKFEDFTKSERGGSAYATFGGNKPDSRSNKTDSNESNQDNSNKGKLCPCGQPKTIHPRWEECEYLNEQIQQDNWTADPTIMKKVAEEATSWKGLKSFIDQHKKQERPPITVNTVYRAVHGTDPLMHSVIHDSGATESISNDLSRMEDFVPERIQIRGFGGSIWAEGRGTMVVWATAPGDKEKSQELRIRNALYCPDGPVSLISGKALNRNGIFKNEEKNVLYTRKGGYQAIAKLRSINDQAVIEYNPPNQANAYALEAPKLSTIDKKHVYKNRSSKSGAPKSQGVVGQRGQNKLNNTSDSQNKLNFKLTSTTSLNNGATRLPTIRPESQKLQIEAAREPIKQASRANEISTMLSETLHLSPG
jgi:hypothetical protein